MKIIKVSNGEVRLGFEFDDLSEVAQYKALYDQIEFEIAIMQEDSMFYYIVEEMEKMRTPWFLSETIYHRHKQDLIDIVVINKFLFDEDGKQLHITFHVDGNTVTKTTFGAREYLCTIEEMTNEKDE